MADWIETELNKADADGYARGVEEVARKIEDHWYTLTPFEIAKCVRALATEK